MENPERITYFAATDARGRHVPFGIKAKDRDRHMYVIGKTGMGKSTLLENMAIQDIRNGEGFAFIDPHGGTVERLLDYIPEERVKDVVYFAPFDMEHPVAFNVMEDVGYDRRHLVVSGLMATFKKIWEDAWSARMEYILTNTLLALLEYPGTTLLGVNRMYTDKDYRKRVIDNVKDPVVKDFWTKEFANYGDRYTQEATPAIQNKVGQFTGNPLIRNIIGQSKSSFDIRTMMDERKILIINLSKGLVGETNMRLLGSMLTTRIFLAAMSRASLPANELAALPHFYFYVDEFQNFANKTFAEILSEARKYKLNLIIAHQYIEQMEEEVRDAVFGNVGTTVVFRVGPFDAEVLETIFMPRFTKEDVVSLDKRQIYLSLMIDGVGSAPFSAITIPPIETPPTSHREEVISASRAAFAVSRTNIENAIMKELSESLSSAPPPDARMRKKSTQRTPPTQEEVKHSKSESLRQVTSQRPIGPHSYPRTDLPRPFSSRSVVESKPSTATKSAEDLKSILRTIAAKNSAELNKRKTEHQYSLKGTLGMVLAKNDNPSITAAIPVPKNPEKHTPAKGEPSISPSQAESKKPFEVPEDALRKVLKGEA